MLCRYCERQAKFICVCKNRICEDHATNHSEVCKVFKICKVEDYDKNKLLLIELSERIIKISDFCNEIEKNTRKLIKKIILLSKSSTRSLEILKKKF